MMMLLLMMIMICSHLGTCCILPVRWARVVDGRWAANGRCPLGAYLIFHLRWMLARYAGLVQPQCCTAFATAQLLMIYSGSRS